MTESSVDGPDSTSFISSGDIERELLIASWRIRVMMYKDCLASVRPIQLILKMKIFNIGHPLLQNIFELDSSDRTTEATEKFLLYLLNEDGLERIEVADRWKRFGQALEEVNKWVYDIMQGVADPAHHELQKNIVTFFMDEICQRVDPQHLLPYLRQLLDDIQYETLCSTLMNSGPRLAAIYMVGYLPQSTDKDWLRKFQQALMRNGYAHLAEMLEDKSYASLMREEMEIEEDRTQVTSSISGATIPSQVPIQVVSRREESMERYAVDGDTVLKTPVPVDIDIHQSPPKLASTSLSPEMGSLGLDTDGESSMLELEDGERLSSVLDDAPPLESMRSVSEEVAASIVRKLDLASPNRHKPECEAKKILAKDIAEFQGDNSNAEIGEEEEEVGEIELRPYQVELARRPLLGQNVIICAPTGSGKTQVALKIMQEHLKQQGQGVRKSVFLVNQVALAEQQYKQCVRHLRGFRCKCVTGNTGDAERVPLKHLLIAADVLVMTAQMLLDALANNELDSICQFSLIVFDECHHTNQRHPFNCIMHHYMAVKYSPDDDQLQRLPQVVGLTASVGVGKANTDVQACNHIRKLCAHLDAIYISTVRHEVEQLAQYTNEPKYDQYICERRQPDRFLDTVEKIMKCIEEGMLNPLYKEQCSEIADKLNPPRQRGTSQYTGWVAQLRKEVAKLRDPKTRRFYESARRMLEFYNTSLVINDECDTEDAFDYLKKQIGYTYENIGNNQEHVDVWLKELFDEHTTTMLDVGQQQANTNPKLMRLEALLVRAFEDEPESRAMIFVKTRDLASALLQWMRRRPNLRPLRPGKMVGAGASAESGGMTKNQQVDVMQFFRDGDHKVMIATSVAEEGLDIRKCNLVIRYNHVTNEIAMVQARGRARAENSKFVTLAGEDRGVQAKDEINFIREMMMRDAIKQLQIEMDNRPEEFRQSLEQIQREEKSQRDIELQSRPRLLRDGEVEFRCRKCDEFAFMSSDVRKIENMHHVVIDLDFPRRYQEKPVPRPEAYGNIEVRGRLTCRSCGDEWGKSILFQRTKFPVVAVSNMVVIDQFGNRDAPKKWKQVKLYIRPLESEELQDYRRQAAEAGLTDE